jgi:membrane protein DedA with SNARE-associated domain
VEPSLSSENVSGSPRLGVAPRIRHLVFALLAVASVMAIVGTALSPYLLVRHPVWLVALAPEWRHIALAATKAPALPIVGVASIRKVLGLCGSYGLGVLYGDATVRWTERRFPKLGRFVRSVERLFARVGLVLLIVAPTHTLSILSGASGKRLTAFLVPTALGQVFWSYLTYRFGAAVSDWTTPFVDFVGRHLLVSTLVTAGAVSIYALVSRLRRKRHPAAAP